MVKYWISEIFTSIQGEGEVIGTPSNFIRLAGCHLRCIWCDTKYAWHKYDGEEMSIEQILDKIDKRIKFTTITGGEPLLQDILPLVEALKSLNHKVLVETSGTIKPSKKLRELVDIFSVSPKLSNSGYKFKYNFKDDNWATYFKFVIVNPLEDIQEIIRFIRENNIEPSKVILQLDGRKENYTEGLRELIDIILKLGIPFRVLPQFHRIVGIQ
ncbi:7-carboxy-7-deazaguanine synthase QueE [Sulfurisphaera ohwakuensis]|uniref:7-carboxy-7-deazaguanine synthase QueE n=1 Tax=Sulfurisphaera ohwakuensis TaxID=69656 RepID=UPI0036F303D7